MSITIISRQQQRFLLYARLSQESGSWNHWSHRGMKNLSVSSATEHTKPNRRSIATNARLLRPSRRKMRKNVFTPCFYFCLNCFLDEIRFFSIFLSWYEFVNYVNNDIKLVFIDMCTKVLICWLGLLLNKKPLLKNNLCIFLFFLFMTWHKNLKLIARVYLNRKIS